MSGRAGDLHFPPNRTVDGSHQRVDELVRGTTGVYVRKQDLDRLARWADGRIRVLALAGVEPYGELLAQDNAAGRLERELLTVRFTTGESYFFRDRGQFALLRDTILPELIERRAVQRSLRIWSAGCATGEEAYSLAMLVDELAPRVAGWNLLILGTDINANALEKARRGVYGQWSFRALDAARRQRYFRESRDEWKIDKRLRDMVTFRPGDLVRDRFPDAESELHDIDLILCRNVFIYLAPRAVAQITAKLADALAEGGTLMTGHSELFGHSMGPGSLRTRVFAESVVFRKSAKPVPEAVFAASPPRSQESYSAAVCLPDPAEQRAVPALPPPAPPTPPISPIEGLEALMQAAWGLANRGACDAAAAACRNATAIAALDPRPYYLLAQLAQERGNAEEAKTMLKKVIYLESSFIAAYLELGALYEKEGDAERARRMRQNARSELKKLPAQAVVEPYGESTAEEILLFVERLLGEPAESAADEVQADAPLRPNGGMHG